MKEILWLVWEWVINVYDAILVVYIAYSMLGTKYNSKAFYAASVAALAICTRIINVSLPLAYSIAAFAALLIIYLLLFANGSLIAKLFWAVFTEALFFGVDILHNSIVLLVLSDIPREVFIQSSPVRLFNMIVTRIVLGVIVVFLSRRKFFASKLSVQQTIVLFLCPLLCCIAIISLIRLFLNPNVNIASVIVAGSIPCLISFLTFFLFRRISIQHNALEEQNLLTQKQELEELQYKQALSSYEKLRVWRHEIRNQFLTIQNMAGKTENAEISRYVSDITNALDSETFFVSTGNAAIDAIVNTKTQRALNNDIAVSLALAVPALDNLAMMDVCSIIGNVWDNAINANLEIENKADRYIEFKISVSHNFCTIHCENASLDKTSKNDPLESEKAGRGHGIGIKRIKQLIRKYDGIYKFTPEEDTFTVDLLIPIETGGENIPELLWNSATVKA